MSVSACPVGLSQAQEGLFAPLLAELPMRLQHVVETLACQLRRFEARDYVGDASLAILDSESNAPLLDRELHSVRQPANTAVRMRFGPEHQRRTDPFLNRQSGSHLDPAGLFRCERSERHRVG